MREYLSLPSWLAPIIDWLREEKPRFATVQDVLAARPELDRRVARRALTELAHRGWLRRQDAPGIYEVAVETIREDMWIFLRAQLELRPRAYHVGATSAAALHGYAEDPPVCTVVHSRRIKTPVGIRANYDVLRTDPATATGTVDGLPVPSPAELLAEIAQLSPRLDLEGQRRGCASSSET